jgi:hypothetical protein
MTKWIYWMTYRFVEMIEGQFALAAFVSEVFDFHQAMLIVPVTRLITGSNRGLGARFGDDRTS